MFSDEEKHRIHSMARERTNVDRAWFYVAVLFAPVAMAVYGLIQRDYLASTVAFFGLLGLVLWHIHQQLKSATHFRTICEKVVASSLMSDD